jgi:hypothetical protein
MLKMWGEKRAKVLVEKFNERNHLADLAVHVNIILIWAHGLEFPWLGYGQVASKEEICCMEFVSHECIWHSLTFTHIFDRNINLGTLTQREIILMAGISSDYFLNVN